MAAIIDQLGPSVYHILNKRSLYIILWGRTELIPQLRGEGKRLFLLIFPSRYSLYALKNLF